MARYLFSLSAALLGLLAHAAPARACSCAELPFEMARQSSVAIFEARVASIEDGADGARHVHLDVVQTWLAAEHEHAEVVTASTEAACGFTFVVGQSYLVYASALEGEAYRVSLCSRTRLMADADDDRALLGSGVVPVDIEDAPEDEAPAARTPPTRAGCASCSVTRADGGLAAIAALAIALALATRRRP
jgi:MYXO-CTERM domain-containing protein